MLLNVEVKKVKHSKPKGNALPNLDERIADVLLLLGGHSGNFIPQAGIRFWLGGKWSSHRIATMDRLLDMGWVEFRRVRQQNWWMLTPSCYAMLMDRKREAATYGLYSEGLESVVNQGVSF
jgi:hypothetical protein